VLIHVLPYAFRRAFRQAKSNDFVDNFLRRKAFISILDACPSLKQSGPNPYCIGDSQAGLSGSRLTQFCSFA
jgi:hypothetical protein